MSEKEKTKEEKAEKVVLDLHQEFEDDVKAHAEESGKTEEEITAAYCHCCGQKANRKPVMDLFSRDRAVCQCSLYKHCYRCNHCHFHCTCGTEKGPTPTVKSWLIEKHGKTEIREAALTLAEADTNLQSLVDYATAYMDLVRSEQYNEDAAAKLVVAAFDALLEFVYGKEIFAEKSRLLDAQKGR